MIDKAYRRDIVARYQGSTCPEQSERKAVIFVHENTQRVSGSTFDMKGVEKGTPIIILAFRGQGHHTQQDGFVLIEDLHYPLHITEVFGDLYIYPLALSRTPKTLVMSLTISDSVTMPTTRMAKVTPERRR